MSEEPITSSRSVSDSEPTSQGYSSTNLSHAKAKVKRVQHFIQHFINMLDVCWMNVGWKFLHWSNGNPTFHPTSFCPFILWFYIKRILRHFCKMLDENASNKRSNASNMRSNASNMKFGWNVGWMLDEKFDRDQTFIQHIFRSSNTFLLHPTNFACGQTCPTLHPTPKISDVGWNVGHVWP